MPSHDDLRAALRAVRNVNHNLGRAADHLTDRFSDIEFLLRRSGARVPATVTMRVENDGIDAIVLSWGKLKNKWQILIEHIRLVGQNLEDEQILDQTPVVTAELRLRKEASLHVADLVLAIAKQAQVQIAELDEASARLDKVLKALAQDTAAGDG